RLALGILAGDRCMEAEPRIRGFDREIRAEREAHVRLQEPPPRVRTGKSLASEAGLGPRHVRGRVRRLHRGDDAQACELRDVFHRNDLRVLDAPAQVFFCGSGAEGFAVQIDN
ncbi:MAG: hypothetical protein RIS71_1287, partial [Actinomycetota bacterium]